MNPKYRIARIGDFFKLQKRFLLFWYRDVYIKDEWNEPIDNYEDYYEPEEVRKRDELIRKFPLVEQVIMPEPEYDITDYVPLKDLIKMSKK